MTGRSMWRAISRTISSVNAPACAETPTSTVTLALRTTSSREMCASAGELPSGHVFAFAQQRLLAGANPLAAFDEQAIAIEGIDALARLLFGQAFFFHRRDEQIDDADARRAGAEHGDRLLASGTPVA